MNKQYLLNESKAFCMLPWVHIHSTPVGYIQHCCISKSLEKKQPSSLEEIVNSVYVKQNRVDLLNDRKIFGCETCYNHEDMGMKSWRNQVNEEYSIYFDEVIQKTDNDGTLHDFKMRYFDIRFNNICNFKCRTCGNDFSTLWEQEDLKSGVPWAKKHNINTSYEFLNDIKDQIPNITQFYFAGGEPLITEEHYIILEEIIKQGRAKQVPIRYSTNLSTLKFKDKDLVELWANFKKVEVFASIDHYGKKAEYIRHGTNWEQIKQNYNFIKTLPFVRLQMNTVLSVFNILTIDDFYEYLYDNDLYNSDYAGTFYFVHGPEEYSPYILPKHLKDSAVEKLKHLKEYMINKNFNLINQQYIDEAIHQIYMHDNYSTHIESFKSEINRIDALRNESFTEVFPELSELMD